MDNSKNSSFFIVRLWTIIKPFFKKATLQPIFLPLSIPHGPEGHRKN